VNARRGADSHARLVIRAQGLSEPGSARPPGAPDCDAASERAIVELCYL